MEDFKLEDLLRKKLADYEVPVDDSSWEIISKQLQEQKKRKTTITWLIASGAVAAAVALFLLLRGTFIEEPVAIQKQSIAPIVDINEKDNRPTVLPALKTPLNEEAIKPTLLPIRNIIARQTAEQEHKLIEDIVNKNEIITIEKINKEIVAEHIPEEIPEKAIVAVVEKDKPTQENAQDLFNTFPDEEDTKAKRQGRKWSLALAANQSKTIASQATERDPLNTLGAMNQIMLKTEPKADPIIYALSNYLATETNRSINPTKINHRLPLSFGLTFRYYFVPHWAAESGLVYTYLASDYEHNNNLGMKQQLHYLGIPLNLVWQFINSRYISCYVSGGGMLEKGLRADYIPVGSLQASSSHETISGLQWSLGGQLGVGYNVTKRFSLYAEPGCRWFIPADNQPESTRTVHPLNFNLAFGLRTNL